MITKEIKYIDFNDEEVTETVRFHLTKTEILALDAEYENFGGMAKYLEDITKESKDGKQNSSKIMSFIKNVILKSYGVLSTNGKFIKPKEEVEAFACSEAYSELFLSLCQNPTEATEFVNGLLSKDLREKVAQAQKQEKLN